ncbi:MAG TPA: tryptophan--tRNA ligase [Blastocatellia bacterium]|nr:tryptophan--tRNA ligase [Blastocatellia bacterium]
MSDKTLTDVASGPKKKRIVSGMRPTGNLHLGNYEGALKNWIRLQDSGDYECFYFIADLHALTSDYADTSAIKPNTIDMVSDWIAAGLDPERSTIFLQSMVPEHSELHVILSAVTPLGWLERVPTYKEQRENITEKDIGNYAFLGYPVLQAADIIMYKADYVPVGKDQASHVELTREIVRRFNNFFGEVFPEPKELHTEVPVLPGTDGRKMSKSYGNAIYLVDSPDVVREKARMMITDRTRIKRTDPGHPENCDVCQMHRFFLPKQDADRLDDDCRNARIGCVDRKRALAESILERYGGIAERSRALRDNPDRVVAIIREGSHRARREAQETMAEVRRAIRMDWE